MIRQLGDKAEVTREAPSLPWVEKYRPKTVNDVVHQDEIVNVMKKVLQSDVPNLPHLLFYGPPGTGKTSVIQAACRQLYGPKYYSSRVCELNASDDRGIKVIREKVKTFAQAAVHTNPELVQNGVKYPVPPYKVIVLDEADALLPDAQGALRRIIEQYCNVTRFCLICNYVSRIIEPLVSRCAKFRFRPVKKEAMIKRIKDISDKESIVLSDVSLLDLHQVSCGDLRLAVQYLQGAQKAYGNDLSNASFSELSGRVPDHNMRQFYETFWSNSFFSMQKVVKVCVLLVLVKLIPQKQL